MVLKKRIIATLVMFISMLSVFLYSSHNAVAAYESGSGQISDVQRYKWGSSDKNIATCFNLKDENGRYYSGMCMQHTYTLPTVGGSMTYKTIPNDSLTAKGLAYGMENGYYNGSDTTKIGIMNIAMTFLFAEDERKYGFRASLGGAATVDPAYDRYWYPERWYANGVTKEKVDEYIRNAKNYRVSKFAKLGVCLGSDKRGQTIGFFKEFSNERDDVLRLWKFADNGGNQVGLKGATFGIYTPDGKLKQKLDITDSNYGNRIDGLQTNVEYTIREITAPEGYSKDYSKFTYFADGERITIKKNKKPYLTFLKDQDGDYKLETNNTGFYVNSENYLYIKNRKDKPGEYGLRLKKIDEANNDPLSGAKFSIVRESDFNKGNYSNPLLTLTTDIDGYANFSIKDLKTNEYDDITSDNFYLVETDAPSGYAPANHKLKFKYDFDEDKFQVELSDLSGGNVEKGEEVNVKNSKLEKSIKIIKKKSGTDNRIAGVKFLIVKIDINSLEYMGYERVVTNDEGIATLTRINNNTNLIYKIVEEDTPKSYAGNRGKIFGFFRIKRDGSIEMFKAGKYSNEKVYYTPLGFNRAMVNSGDLKRDLQQLKFEGKDTNIDNDILQTGLEYSTVRDGNSANSTILITNSKTHFDLKVVKKDFNTGKIISGVEFELKTGDGRTIAKERTNKDGELIFEALKPSDSGYVLEETSDNPEILVKNKPFKFDIMMGFVIPKENNTETNMYNIINDSIKDYSTIEVKNKVKNRISISKKDAELMDNEDNLINARFELYKYDLDTHQKGDLVTRFTTEQYKNSDFEVPNGTYLLEETTPPLGYKNEKGCYIFKVNDIKFNDANGNYESGVECLYVKDKENIAESIKNAEVIEMSNVGNINKNTYSPASDKNSSLNYKIKNYKDDSVILPDTGSVNKYQPIFLIGIVLSILCVYAAKTKTRKA